MELDSLGADEFVRILTEPKNALIKQYVALMDTEGLALKFGKDGINEVAQIAARVNDTMENIGARRLYTVLEKLLEEISFNAPEMGGQTVEIDAGKVRESLSGTLDSEDLTRFIL